MPERNETDWRWFVYLTTLLGTVYCAVLIFTVPRAVPVTSDPVQDGVVQVEVQVTEPYGGCKEAADYPGTPGYRDCQTLGLIP